MFKPVRILATIVFIASIVLVFLGAFVIGSDVRLHFSLRDVYSQLCSRRYCALVRTSCVFGVYRARSMLTRRTAPTSSRYRGIPRLYMVHAFVHTVRPNGGTQGLRHVMYHSRVDTRSCVQNATIHYACLTFPNTMIARVATAGIYVVLMTFSSLNYSQLSVCWGNDGHKPFV